MQLLTGIAGLRPRQEVEVRPIELPPTGLEARVQAIPQLPVQTQPVTVAARADHVVEELHEAGHLHRLDGALADQLALDGP